MGTPNNWTAMFLCIGAGLKAPLFAGVSLLLSSSYIKQFCFFRRGVGLFSTTFIHFWRRKSNLYALKC